MSFTVYVDEQRWRAHLSSVLASTPGLVPVIKGNGYGLGLGRLAAEASRLGVPAVAVGTIDELPAVRAHFAGDVLVMTPAHPAPDPDRGGHLVQTVSHLEVLRRSGGSRVVLEAMTSMRRHGIGAEAVGDAAESLAGVRLEGLAFHLPLDRHGGYDPVEEVASWLRRCAAAGIAADVAWVSHLSGPERERLRAQCPATELRPRVGTALWLGDRGALVARGTVLDVHPLARGQRYGYRRRRAVRDSHLVVVGGGTAHGVALAAPRQVRGPVGRAKELAVGSLAAANLTLSPFRWAGRQRWFAEPPHMHVSLVLLPASVHPPGIGDELDCDVRLTTVHPDHVRAL
jgi:alanine racemase